MLHVAILGSTGSIGVNTLQVIAHHPEKLKVVALSAGSNVSLLCEQAARFRPEVVCIGDQSLARELKNNLDPSIRIVVGEEGLQTCASWPSADAVVVAIVGSAGLPPTCAAARAGKRICLANKEALVAGGQLVMNLVRQHQATLLPIDSEHSAIFQCLAGNNAPLNRIYLTASGGPFRNASIEQLSQVKPADALRHPNWNMGAKVTIDSATLMNKGLEVIEAHWLFGLTWQQIQVVVHPQSVIHSMVEFIDGSILAQLGAPDMRLPIQVALMHPERWPSPATKLNLLELAELTFEAPDTTRFPCLELAYAAGKAGGTMPVVLNAANEVAVQLFLQHQLAFTSIPKVVETCMARHQLEEATDISIIMATDKQARQDAAQVAAHLR